MPRLMSRPVNAQWPHRPETLALAELSYNVKFYGMEEVQQPRGAEPVAEAVKAVKLRKLQRKASGQKSSPRVEVVVSLGSLIVQDRKTKAILYQFPMDGISYCANDQSEKKLFSFIARDGRTGKHNCYVFGCEHNQADEILQTLGQAFDLNYRKHLDSTDKQSGLHVQLTALQQRVAALEQENSRLKGRVVELESAAQRCTCGAGSGAPARQAALPAAAATCQSPTNIGASTDGAYSSAILVDFAAVNNSTGTAAAAEQRNACVDLFGMESFQPPAASAVDAGIQQQGACRSNPWLGNTAQVAFGYVSQPKWS